MSATTTLVLNTRPDTERCAVIAEGMAEGYDAFWWVLSDDVPEEVDMATADQLLAHKRDAGEDAVFMIVWMTND